jgi:hypothetical protein
LLAVDPVAVAVGAAPTWDVGLALFEEELFEDALFEEEHAARPPASRSKAPMAAAVVYRKRMRL